MQDVHIVAVGMIPFFQNIMPMMKESGLTEVGTEFPRSEEVVSELEEAKMFQAPAPLPWRQAELEYLQKGLGLPDF
jgi:hypothetical protein